jgi:hypothetical protein
MNNPLKKMFLTTASGIAISAAYQEYRRQASVFLSDRPVNISKLRGLSPSDGIENV